MIDDVVRAAPPALASSLLVAGIGTLVLLLLRLRLRSLAATTVALVLVPLLAALAGIVAFSGFMYTPQLGGTIMVCALVAAITVPAGLFLGRGVAREAMWLSEARAAERRSEESRHRLVAGMSHDLRSPLAGIRGMTDAVLDGVVHDPAEVCEYLARIRRETLRMTAMVEDLFQVSRATSGTLELVPGPVALAEVASDAVAAVGTGAVDVRAVDPADWPVALGSDLELTRVLRNVLDNAVRHTPDGGAVTLSAGCRGDVAFLRVDDRCGGVPDDELPRLFEIGYRGAAARTPTADGGAGLGLAIARGLMRAQHGEVTIANHGPGCRVELTLPLAPVPSSGPRVDGGLRPPAPARRNTGGRGAR